MISIQENYSLRSLNTFGMDVKARYFCEIKEWDELKELFADPHWKKMPRLVLGGGSNMLLCSDFDGLVLHVANKGMQSYATDKANEILLEAAAGEIWHDLVMYSLKNGWYGLENLALIPGQVGAAPIQNIGAYGVEMKDHFHSLKAFRIEDGAEVIFNANDCAFGYRDSVFKRAAKEQYIIWSVQFCLHTESQVNSRYGAIQETLKARGVENPGPMELAEAVMEIRRSKLPDPAKIGNSGSFFKNPEIAKTQFEKLQQQYPEMPFYPLADPAKVKVPAGWMIEKCGWKAFRRGDAGCHEKQALVLVNYGQAGGSEIWQLALDIMSSVQEKFGIPLEAEVNVIGL